MMSSGWKNEKVVELLLKKEGIDVNAQNKVRPPAHPPERKGRGVG